MRLKMNGFVFIKRGKWGVSKKYRKKWEALYVSVVNGFNEKVPVKNQDFKTILLLKSEAYFFFAAFLGAAFFAAFLGAAFFGAAFLAAAFLGAAFLAAAFFGAAFFAAFFFVAILIKFNWLVNNT